MKIKKRSIFWAVIVLALVVLSGFYYYNNYSKKQAPNPPEENKNVSALVNPLWSYDSDGFLAYPEDRGEVKFLREDYKETDRLLISKVVFESAGTDVYGLLLLPKNATNLLPGVVLLPGAGVPKESELPLAEQIAELGIAVLTIDHRGIGETKSPINTFEQDYKMFLEGKEPYQHLVVFDALRAFDLLKGAPFVDSRRVMIAGESFGGRTAIIASAIDKNVRGALAISTAGFNVGKLNDTKKEIFFKSIDPDHYVSSISPRKIVMIQNYYDKSVPLQNAITTYQNAQQPKKFALINDSSCNHGYCDSMYGAMIESIIYIMNK
ncbi:MAG TPA: acetylxylan esterase [Candidatus Nanoarchaeia archaeon]|nr:acetylxylan esterase [Candidatus Nanoarchaeia archaeon]